MKYLMIVLAIHFIGEVITNKRKEGKQNYTEEGNEKILHPAEFYIR